MCIPIRVSFKVLYTKEYNKEIEKQGWKRKKKMYALYKPHRTATQSWEQEIVVVFPVVNNLKVTDCDAYVKI